MKQFLKAAAVAALGLISAGGASAQSALNEILDSGVMKVGTTGDWNPMSLRDPATNSYKGFDIDIMTELAKDLGVEVEFVPTDWKTLVNGVVAGQYHLTGSASISPARMKVAGFSESYISVEMYPFTTEDKADRFDGYDSINNPDVTVATTLGTVFEKNVREWFPQATIKVVEAPARGFQEVLAGRADVFITSNIEGATLTSKFPVVRVTNAEARSPTAIAMLLPQADQVWINYVNNWVKVKQTTGFFEGIKEKWGL
ncbi:transporter substrate-binding domain-containing protein [Phaeobacter italicus]|jgi:cyclohexadienyl dehydratase|uniref:transporter substrate-binding domain-containing protein n=1 Tax=Phaeobacter italicus TaxID=481446 RepID=UPI0001870114|nr:transporter substrate-binding domain-containing protein [Phaeobacter italicus]EEB69396.1 putative carboxycyclohexadienyl dehydratase [Ruegeria sp. R11]MEE2817280.1 transporter substrate-binding domain-containing protein [Pseudomonadota bacterium]NKX40045.1 transporter substrate-binding domain-containing protein [Rhodobacteraceae bacterium R_SAG2]NKX71689.1 transporter substrate-binding domain-containing protein [Rhodobacteraceae bacterium R_SAG1]MBY6045587.1 transporter substrate-binding do